MFNVTRIRRLKRNCHLKKTQTPILNFIFYSLILPFATTCKIMQTVEILNA